jgi:hypothetical protein
MNWLCGAKGIVNKRPNGGVVKSWIDPLEDFDDDAQAGVWVQKDFLRVRNLAEVPGVLLDGSWCERKFGTMRRLDLEV